MYPRTHPGGTRRRSAGKANWDIQQCTASWKAGRVTDLHNKSRIFDPTVNTLVEGLVEEKIKKLQQRFFKILQQPFQHPTVNSPSICGEHIFQQMVQTTFFHCVKDLWGFCMEEKILEWQKNAYILQETPGNLRKLKRLVFKCRILEDSRASLRILTGHAA